MRTCSLYELLAGVGLISSAAIGFGRSTSGGGFGAVSAPGTRKSDGSPTLRSAKSAFLGLAPGRMTCFGPKSGRSRAAFGNGGGSFSGGGDGDFGAGGGSNDGDGGVGFVGRSSFGGASSAFVGTTGGGTTGGATGSDGGGPARSRTFGGSLSGDGSAAVVRGSGSAFFVSGNGTGGGAGIGAAGFSVGVVSLAHTASPHTPRADAISMVRQYFKGILPPQCSVHAASAFSAGPAGRRLSRDRDRRLRQPPLDLFVRLRQIVRANPARKGGGESVKTPALTGGVRQEGHHVPLHPHRLRQLRATRA